tara:strand:- start:10 stop:183 length:174 start_codon:yes stop_codon:yes gene_type:complete
MAKAVKKLKGLTDRQKATMKKHSVHHTAKHMASMKKAMLSGKSFNEAHKIAMKQVGK